MEDGGQTETAVVLQSAVTLVLGDWLANMFLPMTKTSIVRLCMSAIDETNHHGDYTLQFEAMGGSLIASGHFSKQTTCQELHAFVRKTLSQQQHGRRSEDGTDDGSSSVRYFTLCYGTYEVPQSDDIMLCNLMKPNCRTLTVVFMLTPDYDHFHCINWLSAHRDEIASIAVSPDGKMLATGSWDHRLRIWAIRKKYEKPLLLHRLEHYGRVTAVIFSPDSRTLLSGTTSGGIQLWNLGPKGGCLKTFYGHRSGVGKLSFNPGGTTFWSGSQRRQWKLYSIESGKCLQTSPEVKYEFGSSGKAVSAHPDGRVVVMGSIDGKFKVLSKELNTWVDIFERPNKSWIVDLVFSPDGKRMLSGTAGGVMELWSFEPVSCLQKFQGHYSGVFRVAFSPDQRTVLSTSEDRTIKIWDAATGTCIKTLSASGEFATAIAFSPDGRTIVAGTTSGNVGLWGSVS